MFYKQNLTACKKKLKFTTPYAALRGQCPLGPLNILCILYNIVQ